MVELYIYDVAISYAREDFKYAEALATNLQSRKVKVFFDKYEKSSLWGKDLYPHLFDLYQNRSRYCVVLLSKHYATKGSWASHELKAAQARAFKEAGYILPV